MKSSSDEQPARKGDIEESSCISAAGLPESRWRIVEVAASFRRTGMPAGGGFLLRNPNSTEPALLAEAFLLDGKSALFVEASALREAMQRIIDQDLMGPKGVYFVFESAELFDCLAAERIPDEDALPIIQQCRNLQQIVRGKIRFWQELREDLGAAKWLAEHGRICCQPRCQWDNEGPWPPELAVLLGTSAAV